MNAVTDLIDLQRQGIELDLIGDDLKVSAPRGGLDAGTVARLRAGKPALVELMRHLGIDTNRDVHPCSFGQERLWMLERLHAAAGQYHMPLALRLRGALDVPALARALRTLVERHDVLRTAYRSDAQGQVVQVVRAASDVALPVEELDGASPQDEAVRERMRREAARPFDLAGDLMLRARLLRFAPDDHALLLTLHHIAADGWSLGLLARELGPLYDACCRGQAAEPSAPALRYVDYARWQRQTLQGDELERLVAHWTARLQGVPSVHGLPLDRARPAVADPRCGVVRQRLDATLHRRLLALANAHGATLFMALSAAFAALLSRQSGADDIVVGTPIAGRGQAEVASLVGFLVNTLVLRSDLSADPSFEQLLAQSRERLLQAYEHQQLPFEKLVDALRPERSMSHTPIFQVMLVLQNQEAPSPWLGGLQVDVLEVAPEAAKFDLTLQVEESADGLELRWEYAAALFDASTIERMASHLEVLLAAALDAPDTPVSRLPLMSPAERAQLAQWNATAAPFPSDTCLHELFERQSSRRGDAVALQFEGQSLTYAQLNAQANRLARHLVEHGVKPDTLVAVCMERSLQLVVALLGVLKAGGAYVPVDPGYPADRIAYMIEDCGARVLLSDTRLRPALPPAQGVVLCLDDPALQAQLERLPASDIDRKSLGLTPAHLAYMIYTSGSTGKPKGAMNEHAAVMNRLHWMQHAFCLRDDDAVLQKTPFGFDVSVWEFFWPLQVGARLVIARPDGHKEPDYLASLIDAAGVTTLHFVPSMLQAFVTHCARWPGRGVRRVFCSGEALAPALRNQFIQAWPHVELHNLYGPTEAAVDVTWHDCGAEPDRAIVPIGRPIHNTQMHVLDRHLEPVPIGVAGELHIGGVQVARGYRNRAELTAQRFIADPFGDAPGARLYKTGDLGRWLADGSIEYLGRNDHQVKIRGFRIELGEIESCLRRCAGVREAAVLAREAAGGDKRLVAYVVAQAPAADLAAALRSELAQHLPEFMVPAAFVLLPQLPLTPNGKLDSRALPEPDAAQSRTREYEAPVGAVETALAQIWQALLGVERISRRDAFFELGGHSLLALKMLDSVNTRFAKSLPTSVLFQQRSLCDLAACIDLAPQLQELDPPVALFREGSSDGMPLLLVHPVGGSSLCYGEMLRHLDWNGPVWACQQTDDLVAAERDGSMGSLAQRYVDAWRRHAGGRRVGLLGWSFGGVLAHEMAQRFEDSGVSVVWLGMIDSFPGKAADGDAKAAERDTLTTFALDLGFKRADLEPLAHARLDSTDEVLARLLEIGQRQRLLPSSLSNAELAERYDAMSANQRRLSTYRPSPWQGRAAYFRALASREPGTHDALAHWQSLLPALEVQGVDADHFSIVKGEPARTLASLVSASLKQGALA